MSEMDVERLVESVARCAYEASPHNKPYDLLGLGVKRRAEREARAATLAVLREIRELTDDEIIAGARAASTVEGTEPPVPYDECDAAFRLDWENEIEASHTAIIDALIRRVESGNP